MSDTFATAIIAATVGTLLGYAAGWMMGAHAAARRW